MSTIREASPPQDAALRLHEGERPADVFGLLERVRRPSHPVVRRDDDVAAGQPVLRLVRDDAGIALVAEHPGAAVDHRQDRRVLRAVRDVDVERLRRRRCRRRDRARPVRPAGRANFPPGPSPLSRLGGRGIRRLGASGCWAAPGTKASRAATAPAASPTAPAATTASRRAAGQRRIVMARPPTSGRHRPARCSGLPQPEPGVDLGVRQRHFMHLRATSSRRRGGGEPLRRAGRIGPLVRVNEQERCRPGPQPVQRRQLPASRTRRRRTRGRTAADAARA